MIRTFIVILLTLGAAFSVNAQATRPINEVSIVALIITSGDETPVSVSVTHTLESLDAQVLTANAPNASELRSILKRFTGAAIDVDVALVYYDGAVLKIGDRDFVAPGGITLRRPSDLLTKAIPLSALARATALAGNGGAVLVHSSGQNITLIDGISLVETAPAPRTGTSPILFATSAAAMNLADALETMAETSDDIDLNDALRGLAALDGVSISQQPAGSAMLRVLQAPEAAPATPAETTEAASTSEAAAGATPPETSAAEASGMNLPQVGAGEAAPAATSEITADTTSDTTTATATTTEDPTEPAVIVAQDTLPLDVLRAQQSALTRGQKRVLQQHLRNLGFYRGLIDGIFGPQSERAISAYQESIGATVTGVLTPSQLEALSE